MLKKAFTNTPILTIFNPKVASILETDTSDGAIAAVYTQPYTKKNGKEGRRIVAYFSRKLTLAELNYNVYNKELLAIVKALKH